MIKITNLLKYKKILRGLILLIPSILTVYYLYYVFKTTYTPFDTAELTKTTQDQNSYFRMGDKFQDFIENIYKIKDKEKNLGSLVGLPGNLFGYNLHIKNNSKGKTEDNRIVNIVFGININGIYKSVDYEKPKKVATVSDLNNLKIQYSFNSFFENGEKFSGNKLSLDENYKTIDFYFIPTLFSSLVVFLFGLILTYGFLLLIANYYKFIVFTFPFDYKKNSYRFRKSYRQISKLSKHKKRQ